MLHLCCGSGCSSNRLSGGNLRRQRKIQSVPHCISRLVRGAQGLPGEQSAGKSAMPRYITGSTSSRTVPGLGPIAAYIATFPVSIVSESECWSSIATTISPYRAVQCPGVASSSVGTPGGILDSGGLASCAGDYLVGRGAGCSLRGIQRRKCDCSRRTFTPDSASSTWLS